MSLSLSDYLSDRSLGTTEPMRQKSTELYGLRRTYVYRNATSEARGSRSSLHKPHIPWARASWRKRGESPNRLTRRWAPRRCVYQAKTSSRLLSAAPMPEAAPTIPVCPTSSALHSPPSTCSSRGDTSKLPDEVLCVSNQQSSRAAGEAPRTVR